MNDTKTSKASLHTPGPRAFPATSPAPWEYVRQSHLIRSADGEVVVGCNHMRPANIRLIAAAPELLAALEGLLGPVEARIAAEDQRSAFARLGTERVVAARAAIAKARGTNREEK